MRRREKTHPECGLQHTMEWGPRLNKGGEEDAS